MNKDQITLNLPSLLVRDSYIQALKEGFYRGAQPIKTADEIIEIENNYENYIASLNKPITGMISAPDGHQFPAAPYETLWMSEGETFIGEYSFRHSLTDFLMNVGGHIGYGIRPSHQGMGYATYGMTLLIKRARDMNIDRLLLTCAEDNPASEKVIVKSGGIFENLETNTYGHGPVKRFWIQTNT